MKSRIPYLALLVSLGISTAQGQEFEVRGKAVYSRIKLGATEDAMTTSKGDFRVSVKDCLWNIRATRGDDNFDYIEVGTDGTLVYSVTSIESSVKRAKEEGRTIGSNPFMGLIEKTTLPNPADAPLNRVLFWMFASHCYFRTNSLDAVAPIRFVDVAFEFPLHQLGIKYPSKVEIDSRPPGLPSRIINLDDGKQRSWATPNRSPWVRPPQLTSRPAPLDRGFTNVILTVTEWRECENFHIPQSGTVEIFVPFPKDGVLTPMLVEKYEIQVERCSTSISIADMKPAVNGEINVGDFRFLSEKEPVFEFSYSVPDGRWLDGTQVKQTPEYQRQKASQPLDEILAAADETPRRNTRGIILTLATVVLGSTIILISLIRKGERRKQQP